MRVLDQKEAKKFFSEQIMQEMTQLRCFDPLTHTYLTELMTAYLRLSDDPSNTQFQPTVNTKTSSPFIIQHLQTLEDERYNYERLFSRMQAIGATLLYSTGYFPESLTDRTHRANRRNTQSLNSELDYFTTIGARSYLFASRAIASTVSEKKEETSDLMQRIGSNFKKYAGVLFGMRTRSQGLPMDFETLHALSHFYNKKISGLNQIIRN